MHSNEDPMQPKIIVFKKYMKNFKKRNSLEQTTCVFWGGVFIVTTPILGVSGAVWVYQHGTF